MVEHQPEQQRFVIRHGDQIAHLDYLLSADQIDFVHTWTPPALRGQGLAAELVAARIGWARLQPMAIHASCSYVREWLTREQSAGRGNVDRE